MKVQIFGFLRNALLHNEPNTLLMWEKINECILLVNKLVRKE